jgi:hypothetical protein
LLTRTFVARRCAADKAVANATIQVLDLRAVEDGKIVRDDVTPGDRTTSSLAVAGRQRQFGSAFGAD